MRYSEQWPVIAKQLDTMQVGYRRGVKDADARQELEECADFAIANKKRYLEVAARVGAHWVHIAVVHRRESDADKNGNPRFDTYLGNGQPLSKKTTIVPRGRGPWKTFEDGAADAWHVDALDSVKDWCLEKMLFYCIILNGTGYYLKGLPSPYLWALSSVQVRGKYTDDGKFSQTTWDTQPGCAPLMLMIAQRDKSVTFIRES